MINSIAPKEALAWFDSKSLKVGFDYRDVWQQEHSKAFTVAKAMQVDILSDIKTAIESALKDGKTFSQFRAELTPVLQDKGWWGRQEMTDPLDGRLKEVQLGSARRLRTIYRTNMRTSRAAGQWQRIQRTAKSHPFLQYNLGPSEHHRTEHESWNKLVLPANDPFWHTHFVPNGWGCKCRIRQISTAEAKRLGINTAPPIQTQEWVNKRTGEVHQVPKGIDPGWAYNPGTSRNQPVVHLIDKLEVAALDISEAAVDKLVQSKVFENWYQQPQGEFPVAILDQGLKQRLKASHNVVRLSKENVYKKTKYYADLSLSEYRLVSEIIKSGQAVLYKQSYYFYLQKNRNLYCVKLNIDLNKIPRIVEFYKAKDRNIRAHLRKGELIRKP
ncbi:MAG: head morphogenesis protein [Oceanospirillaceae bacterium]|nr:head morphogenesis protein [Oceanospirillaceae bacterium]